VVQPKVAVMMARIGGGGFTNHGLHHSERRRGQERLRTLVVSSILLQFSDKCVIFWLWLCNGIGSVGKAAATFTSQLLCTASFS
jgi:hypothetical protein